MRGKTSKKYRKLMQQYDQTFGFREPYQVLVDAQMIQDTSRFTMDIFAALERTLRGKVKPMITQCSIRHLYALPTASIRTKHQLINLAKQMERRRCNHHTLDTPLSTLECFTSVIDPKSSNTNKNRYVIASQEEDVRKYCRGVRGVPLVYVKRSVMIMEPMADSSVSAKQGFDRGKFRTGLRDKKGEARKRKRGREEEGEDGGGGGDGDGGEAGDKGAVVGDEQEEGEERAVKKKRIRGPKGPNPLSVKKPKKRAENMDENSKVETGDVVESSKSKKQGTEQGSSEVVDVVERPVDQEQISSQRKRKRKHKPSLLSDPEQVLGLASIEDT